MGPPAINYQKDVNDESTEKYHVLEEEKNNGSSLLILIFLHLMTKKAVTTSPTQVSFDQMLIGKNGDPL